MPGRIRRFAVAALFLVVAIASAGPVQAGTREFIGSIQTVSAEGVVVRNRSEDQRRFVRTKRTRVTGRRASWTELRAGDSVIVTWSMDDDPAALHRIDVLSTSRSR